MAAVTGVRRKAEDLPFIPQYVKGLDFLFNTVDVSEVLKACENERHFKELIVKEGVTSERLGKYYEIFHQTFHPRRPVQKLSVSGKDTDEQLLSLLDQCPGLTDIEVLYREQTTREEIEEIVRRYPLERFVCSQASQNIFGALSQLPSLRYLQLFDCAVTDEWVSSIACGCPDLRELRMTGTLVTDKALKALGEARLPLEQLNLCNSQRITDKGLKELVPSASRLTELILAECDQISDQGFADLLPACKRLFNLYACHLKITDRGLEALHGCSFLKEVSLDRCSSVTIQGIRRLLQACSRIEKVIWNNRPAINQLKIEFPRVKFCCFSSFEDFI